MQHFDINDLRPNLEELYKDAASKAGANGVVIIYKARSPKAASNCAHKASCGFVTKRSTMDGVSNKIVAESLLDASMEASRRGIQYKLCICLRGKK